MDLAVGVISLFWDPVFSIDLFPFFVSMAFWRRRSPEIVFSLFLLHSLFLGSIDTFHLLLFCAFSLTWLMDRITPHIASHAVLAGIFTVAYCIKLGWIQATVVPLAFALALVRRREGEG